MNLAMGSPLYSRIIFIAQPRILSSSMWNRTFVTGLSFQMTPSESWCLSCPIWVSFGSMLKRLGMNNMADYVTFICHWGATGTVISLLADASSVSAAYAKIEADYWLILCCIFMKGYIIYNHSAFKGKKTTTNGVHERAANAQYWKLASPFFIFQVECQVPNDFC